MPSITRDLEEQDRLETLLFEYYEREDTKRTGLHISDYAGCLRKPVLMKEYNIPWEINTLLMFTLGRAFEAAVGRTLLPNYLQEVEVKEWIEEVGQDLEGHIDFGDEGNGIDDWDECLDYEFKLSWKWYPETQEKLEAIFQSNWYWVDQAGTYAIMRRRKACRFAILHISSTPEPKLNVVKIEWSEQEQAELWLMMKTNIIHVDQRKKAGSYPVKVWDKRLCRYCKVKGPCDRIGDT